MAIFFRIQDRFCKILARHCPGFCQVILGQWHYDKGKRAWYYDLAIRYFGPEGNYYQLSESQGKEARSWQYSPWDRLLGLLGLAAWEMVSVQHGIYVVVGAGSTSGELRPSNASAYFKRPVQAGRRVDEPKPNLP